MDYKREVQIRARVESIYNKEEDDFASKAEYDDYLEEREDLIFNLVEGVDTKEMEHKLEAYRRDNAENIARNEARKAERMRKHAADEAEAGIPAIDRAGVSGTAAAFQGGQDAEPHQGMEYTATMPVGIAAIGNAGATAPLAPIASSGDMARALGEQTKEEWRLMALASGWTPEFQKKKAFEAAFGSLFINLSVAVT